MRQDIRRGEELTGAGVQVRHDDPDDRKARLDVLQEPELRLAGKPAPVRLPWRATV